MNVEGQEKAVCDIRHRRRRCVRGVVTVSCHFVGNAIDRHVKLREDSLEMSAAFLNFTCKW